VVRRFPGKELEISFFMCEKTQKFSSSLFSLSLSLLRVRDATTRQTKGEGKEEEFSFLLLLLLLRESVLCVSVRACSHLKNVFSVRIKMRQREIRASDFVFRVFTFFF